MWHARCELTIGLYRTIICKFDGGRCSAKGAEAVDRQGLEEMLRRLEAVDLDSVSRVSDSKVQQAY